MLPRSKVIPLGRTRVIPTKIAGYDLFEIGDYEAKIRRLFGSALIGFFPLTDLSGTIARDVSGNVRNGTYSNVDLANAVGPRGKPVGYWDGANDYCDIYSAGLAGAFNGLEGSVTIWYRVYNPGVLTDVTNRILFRFEVNANNYVQTFKTAVNNQFTLTYRAGAVSKSITPINSSIAWNNFGLTWSKVNDRVRAYLNGIQTGTDLNALGNWAGNLAANTTLLGAQTMVPATVWNGYLAYVSIINRESTAIEMALSYSSA